MPGRSIPFVPGKIQQLPLLKLKGAQKYKQNSKIICFAIITVPNGGPRVSGKALIFGVFVTPKKWSGRETYIL